MILHSYYHFRVASIISFLLLVYTISVIHTNSESASASESSNATLKIGMVKNTFTGAAYSYHAFYDFYTLHYREARDGRNITEDLKYLTSVVPDKHWQIAEELFEFLPLHIRELLPKANVSFLTDTDVHNGGIFKTDATGGRANLYDILMIGHQEYVTQEEYSNLKTFVANGGTLVVLTGNVFYAEVKYDPKNNTITLIKGHDWIYDGKSARRDVKERWENETREWLGSNFYPIYPHDKKYHKLQNNPFEFTGSGGGEEQYYDINNTDIKILMDYDSSDSRYPIATYELDYEKGKVIVIGLPAEDMLSINRCDEGCRRFLSFLDDIIVDNAVQSGMRETTDTQSAS
jgi:hypothetical protein